MKRRSFLMAGFSFLPLSLFSMKKQFNLVEDLRELDELRRYSDKDFEENPYLLDRSNLFQQRHPVGSKIYAILDSLKT